MAHRQEKVQELIRNLAGTFIQRQTDKSSLVTVTSVDVSPDLTEAVVYVTVYPQDRERAAMNFLNRHVKDFKEYVKDNCKMKKVPQFSFSVDQGELNRQRIDTLLKDSENSTE